MGRSRRVCVIGASGFIGSGLVKKLLEKGYTVHATLRHSNDESNVGLLKSFPHAEQRLELFDKDIFNPDEFGPALQGCECAFYVDPPKHETGSQHKNVIEAAIAGSKSIVMCCKKAGTVRRLIFTSSVVSASPLKEDGRGFKDFMDETCWTPLIDSYAHIYCDDFHKDYTYSKTMIERELLNHDDGLQVITLSCGLVGGDTLQCCTPISVLACVSQLAEKAKAYQAVLRFLEELLGKIPLVHIDDVCEAHVFCMENPSINGRFLCASSYVSSQEIANYYLLHYPEFQVKQESSQRPRREIKWTSTKLADKGFVYRYDTQKTLDDCIKCARRFGDL